LRISFPKANQLKFTYRLNAAILVLLGTLGAACTQQGEAETVEDNLPGDPAVGEEIFETGGGSGVPCLACHAFDDTPLVGPSLRAIGEIASSRVEGVSAEEYLRQSIINPGGYIVEGYSNSMNQDYGEKLTEDEINDLVAYLLIQSE